MDHFLGVSTVLNIVRLRFANRVLEPVLNAQHVESVEIVWDESLGLEGRAGYYDNAGAMVDMIQSHLLQVLSILTMEAPASIEARNFRDETAQKLRATKIWDGDAAASSRRARYTSGTVDGRELPDYTAEPGVDPANETETLAEIAVGVNNWRWNGVPFRFRSGKRWATLKKKRYSPSGRPPTLPSDSPDPCSPTDSGSDSVSAPIRSSSTSTSTARATPSRSSPRRWKPPSARENSPSTAKS